jgi:hypothetical protein
MSSLTFAPKSNTVVACSPDLPLVVSNHMSSTLVPISGITSADTSSPRSFCREKKIASGKPLMLRSEFRIVNSVSSVSCACHDANQVRCSATTIIPCDIIITIPRRSLNICVYSRGAIGIGHSHAVLVWQP